MELVIRAFGIATVALGLLLGMRLLRLASRTRSAPELAMGLYCLLVSVGTILFAATLNAIAAGSDRAAPLSAAYTLCIGLGATALAVGIWRIFRPGEAWARALAIGAGVWLGASWLLCHLPGKPVLLSDATPTNALFVAGRAAVYACGAFEAFRYGAQLKRRVALGLADPVSAHQIRLWGIAWSCVTVIAAVPILVSLLLGAVSLDSLLALALLTGVNATAWICTWLAFFPPPAYQRWVAGAPSDAKA
jgi:hypothetical protein